MRPLNKLNINLARSAFSLTELLVVIAIIGIFSALSLGYLNSEVQKSRLVALSQSMTGWLEANRSKALAESAACTIQFSANGNFSGGQSLASITSECAVNLDSESTNFIIPGQLGGTTFGFSRSNASFVFTKRGLSPSSVDQYLTLSVLGADPIKCIKINKYSGLIQAGGQPSSSSSCSDPSAYSDSRPF